MGNVWMEILRTQVEKKGRPAVQKELGVSATTISLVLSDNYGAKTDAIEAKVMNMYGDDGQVNCPHLEKKIDPSQCVENWKRAQVTNSAGNPDTIRLMIACRKCDLRNG